MRSSASSRVLAVALGLVGMVAGTATNAVAEPEVYLNVKVSEDPKDKGKAPFIEAIVVAGPAGKPADKWSLSQVDAKVPVTIPAIRLRKYTEGNDTIAVVLVLEGHAQFIGNETYVDNEDDLLKGVLPKLIPMVNELPAIGPPGSLGAIVIYKGGAEVKLPMGPLANLTGDRLGVQKDYEGQITRDLVTGVNAGLTELRKVTTSRKVMIVVGDGVDTNPEVAKTALAAARKQCESDRIELYALAYDAGIGGDFLTAIKSLVPNVDVVQSIEGISSQMKAIVDRINDRYYLTFPGNDPKLKVRFDWDGKEHEMQLKLDSEVFPKESEPINLALVPVWQPPAAAKGFPWLAVIIPVGALLFIVILAKAFGGKKVEEAPMPMPIMEAPPPPKPVGPMKTVMIGAGGDAEGFPVVGWIVPLNGAQAYQTFRLLQGVTKIGNAGNVHVVIQDGFMSGEHCSIIGSPMGFQLQDNKSTNGCFVNDKKVDRHDLVDNDVITVGKTHVVFKSIN
jgi:hypothetical protein